MDIYVLAPERLAAIVAQFLARFLPHRVPADAYYPVRIGDEPEVVFGTFEELAAFCESRPGAHARAYWNSRSADDPHSAHVFFLPDGGLVLGLSVAAQEQAAWDRWLDKLRSFAGAEYGYWTGECPPEDTVAAFVRVAEQVRRTRARLDPGGM